jgi:hypothetical protein
MFDIINVDWTWMFVGFVVGVGSSWAVCDLVFPVRKK